MAVNTAPAPMSASSVPRSGSSGPGPSGGGPARPGSPRLYLREDELAVGLALVFDAAAALKAACEPQRTAFGLSWADARAMAAARTPTSVLAMAARLAVAKQTLTKTLAGLEARGLVTRTIDPGDARRRLVALTPEGERMETAIAAAMRARLANAYRAAGGEAVAGSDLVLAAVAGRLPAAGARTGGDRP